jgi:hypothetical protein
MPGRPPVPAHPRPQRPRLHRPAGDEALQIVGELRRRSVAMLRLLRQRHRDDRLEVARHALHVHVQRGRRLRLDRAQQLWLALADERRATGDRFVERGAERVDVRAVVDRQPAARHLFGRRVRRRAEEVVRARQAERHVEAGEAEVEQHRLPVRPHDQVLRLHVAMHDASLVRVGQGARHRGRQRRGEPQVVATLRQGSLVEVQRCPQRTALLAAARDRRRQGRAGHELHAEPRRTVGAHPDLVHPTRSRDG